MIAEKDNHPSKEINIVQPLYMTEAWWRSFLTATDSMTSARVFKGAFKGEVENLKDLLISCIHELYRVKKNDYGFRCYVDGIEQDQKYVLRHFTSGRPFDNERLEQWTSRILEKEKIALIFNHCEHFSDAITQQLSLYILPLLERIGMPINGLHTTVFIGNYQYTPLGIHQDIAGANVIHFHLGPGKKIMYTWEPELYTQLTGGKKNNQEIDPLLQHSSRFDIDASDIYFMPWSQYHVGSSNELSAVITIWFDNHQKKTLVNKFFDHFKRNYFEFSGNEFIEPEKNKTRFNAVGELSTTIRLDPWQENMTFRELFQDLASEQLMLLLSNGGWREHAPSRQKEENFDPEDLDFFSEISIRLVQPFKIIYEIKGNDHLIVYTRGEKIILKQLDEFTRVIEELNSGDNYSAVELLTFIQDELIHTAAKYLLAVLYNNHSIELADL